MGQSTDAILAYGFDTGYEDEVPEFLGDFDDMEDFVDDALGIPAWDAPDRPAYKELEALRATYPVALIRHCHHEYPMYFLAVPGTEIRARRGSPVAIQLPPIDLKAFNEFTAWCVKHGIAGTPAWHIFSDWG